MVPTHQDHEQYCYEATTSGEYYDETDDGDTMTPVHHDSQEDNNDSHSHHNDSSLMPQLDDNITPMGDLLSEFQEETQQVIAIALKSVQNIEEEFRSVLQMLHQEIFQCHNESKELEDMTNAIQGEISSFLKKLPTAFASLYHSLN